VVPASRNYRKNLAFLPRPRTQDAARMPALTQQKSGAYRARQGIPQTQRKSVAAFADNGLKQS
jgi:hypothetical protein